MTYDIESIVIKVLANDSGNLVIPLKGYSTSGSTNCPYNRKVSVDEGAETTYSGTGGGTLTIATGLVAGSEHLVIIKPTTVDYQWARAFGTDGGSEAAYITEIVQDASYMGYGLSATNAGNYFKAYQYQNCSKLINVVPEVLPDTVTTIGNNFLAALYQGTKISEPTNEVMPNSVTSIGTGFRKSMYRATNIERAPDEVMSDNITTIPNDFRLYMYYLCPLLKKAPNEQLPNALVSIGNNFRQYMFYECSSLTNTVDEYMPDTVTTIGINFRGLQYSSTGVLVTAKEMMSKSLQSIGNYARDYQYYNCANLNTVSGEAKINSSVSVGTGYRRGQYYNCTSLQKARLYAFGGVTNYRQNCFYGITNPITITILGDIVDKPTSQGALSNTNVNKIYVDNDLVASYKGSSSRSSIDDDKFIEIPYDSVSSNLLLRINNWIESLSIHDGRMDTCLLKTVLDGTENRTESNGVFSFSVSGNTQYGWVLSTHGEYRHDIVYNLNQWYWNGGVCFNNNTGFTLASFKAWLAQEYADGTPVIIIGLDEYIRETQVTPYNINTKDGENLIEISQGGPDVNELQAKITIEQATGGYTANVFNGEDYSVESDWIEISDQEVDKGGDVVGPNSSTDGNVVLFDGNTGKVIKDSGVNLSSKQDTLTAGNGIDITSNKISTTYCYGESTTAAATVQKEVSIPSITELNVGQVIIVKPSTTSSVASSTLKLNSFPAYKMLYNGAEITTSTDSVVWSANVPSMFYLDEVSGTKYWRFLGHGLDSNSTYTLNQLLDAGRYKAGVGTYAITRYSLCMMKADGTWEKVTATNANYSTGTSKTVNTNGFVLNQIKFYNTTTTVANGAFVGTNAFSSQAASVRADYSFNCGTAPGWSVGDPIYIVGTIGVDGLFYLDTTARWTTTLPSTNDGKLYIRIGTALTTTDATISFLLDRPIFYYNNGIKEYTTGKIDELETGLATKQDELVSGVNIRTINGTSILGNGDIATPTGIPSQTGEAGKYLTTDGTSVSWGTVSAGVTSVNGNTGAVTVNEVPAVGTNGQVLTVVSGAAAWANAAGSDYSWVTKTISGGEIELGLRTIVNVPTSNFTLTAPATLKDGEEYAIRIISETSYTMTLGTGFTNPRNVSTTLSANATDQYVFLAIGGELELQPLVDTGA